MTIQGIRRRKIIAGALCWIATVEFFLAQSAARLAAVGYSIHDDDISLLGLTRCGPFLNPQTHESFAVCSPLHGLFNGSLLLLGPLMLAGVVLTRSAWPDSRLSRAALVLMAVGAAGPVLGGWFPADTNLVVHVAGAILYFLVGGLGISLLGIARRHESRAGALFSIACGGIAFIAFVLYGRLIYLGLGRGGMERLAAWPLTLWFVATGAALLLHHARR
jgi:hypothetical membrane protein